VPWQKLFPSFFGREQPTETGDQKNTNPDKHLEKCSRVPVVPVCKCMGRKEKCMFCCPQHGPDWDNRHGSAAGAERLHVDRMQ
jgi:hypothetical protein